jgi:hypothetical protein
MTRVQIPPNTDMWARGDRYGEIVPPSKDWPAIRRQLIDNGRISRRQSENIVHVRLDKSGKVVRVHLDDCEVLS